MGRSPRCSKDGLNKGAWTALEDETLVNYVKSQGEGKWSNLAKESGLKRSGRSCRLRWVNYLRPGIKRGNISEDEEELIIRMHKLLGNRWTLIAGRLPGRTDNEIKNYRNSYLAKKMKGQVPLPKPQTEEKPILRLENENKVAVEPSIDTNLAKNKSSTSELTAGLPTREEKEDDFMLDLSLEDLFRMLDSDFAKLGDVTMNELNTAIEGSAHPFLPSERMENGGSGSGSGTECGQDNNNMVSDLRSPLLHPDDGWLGDVIHTLFSD